MAYLDALQNNSYHSISQHPEKLTAKDKRNAIIAGIVFATILGLLILIAVKSKAWADVVGQGGLLLSIIVSLYGAGVSLIVCLRNLNLA